MAGQRARERRGGSLLRQRWPFFFSFFFFDARQPFGTVVATEPVGSEFSALGDQRVRVQTSVMGLEEDKDFKFHKNAVAVLCNR